MRKIIFVLFLFTLIGSIFAGKIIEFPDLVNPGAINIVGNEIFIVDGCTVKIYSLKTFKLETKFGRKGEGPGEFKWSPGNVMVLPDYVFIDQFERIYWFSRQGELIKEKKKSRSSRFIPFNSGNFIVIEEKAGEKPGKINRSIAIYDSELRKIKEPYKIETNMSSMVVNPALNNKNYKHQMIEHFWGVDCDRGSKKFSVADTRKGCYFEVFSENGSKLYTINKKVEKIRLTEAYKKRRLESFKKFTGPMWESINKRTFVFPEFFPSILTFLIKDGKIYVSTYNRKNNKTEFIVLDLQGNILKKTFIPVKLVYQGIPGFTISKGKFYQIIDNEDTEVWELHIHDIK